MAVIAEEEKHNQAMIAASHAAASPAPPLPPPPTVTFPAPPSVPQSNAQISLVQAAMPATTVKLKGILKTKEKL